jgi:signal transduction histidine kinase/HAMP domain-containing protein
MAERRRGWGVLASMRLRQKLTLILSIAALLPVAIASTVAVRLVLDGLESGVRAQTDRTLRVALNLVLGNVKDVFESARRFSEEPALSQLLGTKPEDVNDFLAAHSDQLPQGLVEVADKHGKVVARRAAGARLESFQLSDGAAPIQRALAYERRVTFARAGQMLVMRAASPVVDDSFQLSGAVVVTVPLDSEFADRLKAQLSADVVIYAGDEPTASSFVASDGKRVSGFAAPAAVLEAVKAGKTFVAETPGYGRPLSVGYAPLLSLEGERLGIIAVASDEEHLLSAKASSWRTLLAGGLAAILLAIILASVLSRRLTEPLAHLHAGARAVARGDLDTQLERETGDEIGDLAEAFAQMTRAVRENQDHLAQRMREITTLHEIGRAISSVLGLDDVLRKIVDELAMVLGGRRTALLLADNDGALRIGAGVGLEGIDAQVSRLGEALAWRGGQLLVDDVATETDLKNAAAEAGVVGSLMAVPLEQKDHILGLLLVNREHPAFSEPELRLLFAFADQAATAIQNARLYDEVQKSSEELELKVKERTFELVVANQELERTLSDLGRAQAQLVLSERMAGLGALVAGIAHEINSPAGAIQGAVDTLGENVARLARSARELGELAMVPEDRTRFFALVEQLAPQLTGARLESPLQVRRQSKELAGRLAQLGVENAESACRTLVEIGASEAAYQLASLGARYGMDPLVSYLEQYAYLHRNTYAIRTAIRRITRIVGALKGYSHLDQAKVTPANIHEGIENTLVILHHELKYGITIARKYAELPPIPVYVDELNQVWTNLIHNAVQALGGRGDIAIETRLDGNEVEVAVEDSGSGIPPDVLPRIFEPFFTTKAKGEGTGLGLGIVKQIVEKHGGRIEVASRPGCTRFRVRLPVAGPPAPAQAANVASASS